MTVRAPALGWGALIGAAIAVSFGGFYWQIAFAVFAIGVIGMAHGSSDLVIVPPRQRSVFLALYGGAIALCLLWWTRDPALALPMFLLASAIHFGLEDGAGCAWPEKVVRGVTLVAAPAALHPSQYAELLHLAAGTMSGMSIMVDTLALLGALGSLISFAIAKRGGDVRLAIGTAALLLFPPLVGFSMGFLILHALPQTAIRQTMTRSETMASYIRLVAPTLAMAFVLLGIVGAILLRFEATGVRALFAGIAALAIPHLLVTPWFERRTAQVIPALCAGQFVT